MPDGKRENFSDKTKREALRRCGGHCQSCGKKLRTGDGVEYDHIISDFFSGGNSLANCQVLCTPCHSLKTGGEDAPKHAKARRWEKKRSKTERPKKKIPYRRFDGTPVWR